MPSNAQHRDFSKLCPLIGVFQAIPSVQLDYNVGSPTTFPLIYPIDRYTAMTPSYALCGVCLWWRSQLLIPPGLQSFHAKLCAYIMIGVA